MSRTRPREAVSPGRSTQRDERVGSGRVVRIIGITGRVLVGVGLLLLFYTVYLLWGTGVYTKQAQGELAQQIEKAPLVASDAGSQGDIPPAKPAAQPALGTGLFEIKVDRIGLHTVVVEGVGREELKKGPGHFPDCAAVPAGIDCVEGSAWPGEPGNVAMSGHRTTFGAPFFRLNELQVGDPIDVVSGPVRYRYRVRAHTDGASHEIVPPSAVDVVANHGRAELTLTTCHPRFSAAQRLVVHADYEGASRLDAAPPPTPDGGTAPAPEPELVPDSKPLIPTDVAVLLGIAVAALLAAMALSQRLRNTAIWSGVVIVSAAGLWVAVFPQILRLMPANY